MFIPYHDDNPTHRFPVVTIAVIALNVLAAAPFGFYIPLLQTGVPTHEMRVLWTSYGFVPRQLTNLSNGQPVKVDLYLEQEQVAMPAAERFLTIEPSTLGVAVTLITCMFLHGGPWHLLGNMLFFWIYGNNIEDRLGHVLFAIFYLTGGVVATLCHWAMTDSPGDAVPMIGASGAVASVMGAYIVTFPKARIHVLLLLGCVPLFFKIPAMVVLAFWIGQELLSAYLEQQGVVADVALWAHIGGFFAGAVTMPLFNAALPEPGRDWDSEARDQFDFENLDPYDRVPPDPEQRDMWWEDVKHRGSQMPHRYDPNPDGISWDNEDK